jgi:2-keto-4-pentenoate hydratase/2-oxohepta-3-ene-1,7-dioic acid hydratase in catechol pathway
MRLVTFSERGSRSFRVGVVVKVEGNDFVVDVHRANPSLPDGMKALLEALDGNFKPVQDAAAAAPAEARVPLANVSLGPVVPDPDKILGIGLNYREHAKETNMPLPKSPAVFAKFPNTLIGSGEAIRIAAANSPVDYEAELAVVIGRRAKHVSVQDALSYVAGYSPFNDVSERDFQMRTSQWTLGKSFDTFGPFGPALVTRDEIPDPQTLPIRLRIGDEVLQSSTTADMVFGVADLVSYLSSAMTLVPGDVIATGTPSGVGFKRNPPRFLRPGETVRVEIDRLGVLENPVRLETE